MVIASHGADCRGSWRLDKKGDPITLFTCKSLQLIIQGHICAIPY